MATGLLGNIGGSYIDVYALAITGDAVGNIAAIQEVHLIPEILWVNYSVQNISRAAVNIYEKRGMDTQKDEYRLVEVNKANYRMPLATLSFLERRLEFTYMQFTQDIAVTKFLTPKGDLISEFDPVYEFSNKSTQVGVSVDYTDDRQDPRVGFRLAASKTQSPVTDQVQPEYYVISNSASIYLPLGSASTWAFNYYKSDAVVTKEGVTDENYIKAELGFNCASTDFACLAAEASVVADYQAQRRYGTAEALGGDRRLRAYPQGRYQAAHTQYYATELRWSFDEKVTPFDFWIWKDVSTALQLALFYEAGTVAELKSDLGVITRTSSGLGLRMVSASGFVYRADYANGEEGGNMTLIFDYPW